MNKTAAGWLLQDRQQAYCAAACRLGIGLAVFGMLAVNYSSRQIWAGQASVWAGPARDAKSFLELNILNGASADVATLVYVVTMLAALLFMVGAFTRPMNVVVLIGFIAVSSQNPVTQLQADNLIRIGLLWMLLMHVGEHWSIDRWRRELRGRRVDSPRRRILQSRRSWDSVDVLPRWLLNGLHNVGLIGLAGQIALLYLAGGFHKVTQASWQHGTALYSTLQLPEFRFYPWVNNLISENSFLLALATYAVLVSQLFFVPLLINRVTRIAVVWLAVLVNVFFGILLAQPWAAVAVISVTLVFASDAALERAACRLRQANAFDWFVAAWTRFVLTPYDAVKFKLTGR